MIINKVGLVASFPNTPKCRKGKGGSHRVPAATDTAGPGKVVCPCVLSRCIEEFIRCLE
jgi:hypothetical protein